MRMRSAVAWVSLAWLVAATPAGAAVVRVEERDGDDRFDVESATVIVFDAARGERNRVTVRRLAANRYEFRDSSARLRAGADCTADGRHRVVCSRGADEIFVNLGDRSDTASLRIGAFVTGGGGDDRISGSPQADNLRGGKGRDVLGGGGGADRVVGNEGAT